MMTGACSVTNSTEQSSLADQLTTRQCIQALARDYSTSDAELDSTSIKLLSWNIKKGGLSNWREDLQTLAEDRDLVLLQEATESMKSSDIWPNSGYRSFAPGYRTKAAVTGVATFSKVEPLTRCHLTAYEPWFGTPKATTITQYPLSNTDLTLIVVNTHGVNFTLGLKAFRAQFATLGEVLNEHQGPVIFSGDFNTWRPARYRVLNLEMSELNLQPIEFADDHRTRFFGSTVDHIFIGGLTVQRATMQQVDSSDHNPLLISLSL